MKFGVIMFPNSLDDVARGTRLAEDRKWPKSLVIQCKGQASKVGDFQQFASRGQL